jgi:hypothetical protein
VLWKARFFPFLSIAQEGIVSPDESVALFWIGEQEKLENTCGLIHPWPGTDFISREVKEARMSLRSLFQKCW